MRKKILFICGSMNQTTQMHQISQELPDYEHYFTPYYGDGLIDVARKAGLSDFSVLGNRLVARCSDYLRGQKLSIDFKGTQRRYDLVVTCSDLIVPRNVKGRPIVLVQEGMTDPEGALFHLVRRFRFLPLWLASTAATGLSDVYAKFCVASVGYRDLFVRKGVKPEKIEVTGIPNFDDCSKYSDNDFPHRGFVLVCTSDARETFKRDDRVAFIRKAAGIAAGRKMVFKLHPNERRDRAAREIERHAPGALVFQSGNTEEMIANCNVLVTQYSSTAYVGMALGKEVHSYFPLEELRRLMPEQNACAARKIADVCYEVLEGSMVTV
jgi:hypothetical protein